MTTLLLHRWFLPLMAAGLAHASEYIRVESADRPHAGRGDTVVLTVDRVDPDLVPDLVVTIDGKSCDGVRVVFVDDKHVGVQFPGRALLRTKRGSCLDDFESRRWLPTRDVFLGLTSRPDADVAVRSNAVPLKLVLSRRWFVVVTVLVIALAIVLAGKNRQIFQSVGMHANGRLSASKVQFWLWTFVLLLSVLYLSFLRCGIVEVPETAVLLLGISGGGALGAKWMRKGMPKADPSTQVQSFSSAWKGEGDRASLGRVQLLVWNLGVALIFLKVVFLKSELPDIPEGVLWLMGVSSGAYLGGKKLET
jgi:hypothetical protein